jgi:hypothetical protein
MRSYISAYTLDRAVCKAEDIMTPRPAGSAAGLEGASAPLGPAPPAEAARPVFDPRTRRLLEALIAATLRRLAAANMLVMAVQASLGLVETYFIGWLGTDALAGIALVFPAVILMQMMSAGAVGGGIASSVARFTLAAGGGWLAFRLTGDPFGVFAAHAAALVAFGAIDAGAVAAGAWSGTRPRRR